MYHYSRLGQKMLVLIKIENIKLFILHLIWRVCSLCSQSNYGHEKKKMKRWGPVMSRHAGICWLSANFGNFHLPWAVISFICNFLFSFLPPALSILQSSLHLFPLFLMDVFSLNLGQHTCTYFVTVKLIEILCQHFNFLPYHRHLTNLLLMWTL